METGIMEVDVHGMNCEQAKQAVEKKLVSAGKSVYYIRIIHGFHGGVRLKEMMENEFGYGRHEKVIRLRGGNNPGITEIVLREL